MKKRATSFLLALLMVLTLLGNGIPVYAEATGASSISAEETTDEITEDGASLATPSEAEPSTDREEAEEPEETAKPEELPEATGEATEDAETEITDSIEAATPPEANLEKTPEMDVLPSELSAEGNAPGTRQILTKETIEDGAYLLYHSVKDSKMLDLYCFNSDLRWPNQSGSFSNDYYAPVKIENVLSENVLDKIYRIFYAGYPHNNIGLYVEGEKLYTLEELNSACIPPDEVKQLLPDINWTGMDFNATSVVADGEEKSIMSRLAEQIFRLKDADYIDAANTKKSFYYAVGAFWFFGPDTASDYLSAYTATCRSMGPDVYSRGTAHDATQIAIWRILYENNIPNNSKSMDAVLENNQLVKDLVDFANGKGEHSEAYIPARGSTLEDLGKYMAAFKNGTSLLRSDGTPVGDGKIVFHQMHSGSYLSEPLHFSDEMYSMPYTFELVDADGNVIQSQSNFGFDEISFSVQEAPTSATVILKTSYAIPSDIYDYAKEGEESILSENLTSNNHQHMSGCYYETFSMTHEFSTEFLSLEKTQIHVSKVWEDSGNQDKIRPESITVNLLADEVIVDNARLSEDNHWEHTFENLDLYTDTGNMICYSVKEISIDGYTTVVAGNANDGFIITNTQETPLPVPKTGNLNRCQDRKRYRSRPKSGISIYGDPARFEYQRGIWRNAIFRRCCPNHFKAWGKQDCHWHPCWNRLHGGRTQGQPLYHDQDKRYGNNPVGRDHNSCI